MKKVVTVGIGGRSFVIDEDAYQKLERYLARFRQKTGEGSEAVDIMEDLEQRIAELFYEELSTKGEVVNISMVNRVISQLGMPDGTAAEDSSDFGSESAQDGGNQTAHKRLYRDPDNRVIGGVCSGLGHYLNIDMVLIRVVFAVSLFLGGLGFWAYIIFWIVAPQAMTAAQKCEMRGLAVTAENLRKVSSYK
ncbi:MAG: PspC domain-containing protein [Bacteroidales bacterium]|jgi:phage shock protein PspC (stress-responsive transcriptional regulator)|nr:PspC domain-containing protein [Bacteroidales bacterium]MDD3274090.1 PspC domain-containing protein [Bacteroidales bacterium]